MRRLIIFLLLSFAAGLALGPAASAAETKEAAAFKRYNKLILSFPKAYTPWTQEEISFVSSVSLSSPKKDVFKVKSLLGNKATTLSKDLEYMQFIRATTPELKDIHKKLLFFVSQYVNCCRRAATTLGSHKKSNYEVVMKDLEEAKIKLSELGTLYESKCTEYGISRPAITKDNLWADPASLGKRK